MSGSSENRGPRQRTPRRGSSPTLSVVITATGASEELAACMSRLGEACLRLEAQVVVVVPAPEPEVEALRKRYPSARVVAAPADLSSDDLRGLGLLEAAGDIVAFTDECDLRGAEWLGVLERRARNSGEYGPKPNGKIDWARYLQERGLLSRNGR